MTEVPAGFDDLQARFAPEIRCRSIELADAIDRMADPPARADLEQALDAAHRLKGSARTIAFGGVGDAAERVQQALEDSAGPDLAAAALAARLAVREAHEFEPAGAGALAAAGDAAPRPDRDVVAPGSVQELVVVSVDDDEASFGLLETVIGGRPGVRLLAAGTGAEGLEVVSREQPGLVLLDLRLPDCDGGALLPRLRAAAPGARVVVLTGDASREVELRAAGAADVIQKPLSLAQLRGLVAVLGS